MGFALVISPAIVAEVRATLNYPRIRHKYAVADSDIDGLIELFDLHALWVEVRPMCLARSWRTTRIRCSLLLR